MSRSPARCHPDRPASARGLCNACYLHAYRAGEFKPDPTPPPRAVDWTRAACIGTDPDDWFVTDKTVPDRLAAICKACPITDACLIDAVQGGDLHFGIRGGMTPKQRRMWAVRHGLPRHGTLTGYTADKCHCGLCREEITQYTASRRALPPQLARAGGRRG